MTLEHDFTRPRNLYEKLERDSMMLNHEINGDNFFNFIATAYHLQKWIKGEEGLRSDASVKRLLKRLHDDPKMKLCTDILEAKKPFKISFDETNNQRVADFGEIKINVWELKEEIMTIYHTYFHVKG